MARANPTFETPDVRCCASRGTLRWRLWGAATAAACLGLLACLHCLTPSRGRMGTHRQLGLPACGFVTTTGYPCPTCGMTTSLAEAAHGNLIRSFQAHPMGLVLAAAAALAGLAGSAQAVLARPLLRELCPRLWHLGLALGGLLIGWGMKLCLGVMTGQLPV